MTQPDLTEAVDASAKSYVDRLYAKDEVDAPWDEWNALQRLPIRQHVAEILHPAAQLIYDQGRRDEFARFIEAEERMTADD